MTTVTILDLMEIITAPVPENTRLKGKKRKKRMDKKRKMMLIQIKDELFAWAKEFFFSYYRCWWKGKIYREDKEGKTRREHCHSRNSIFFFFFSTPTSMQPNSHTFLTFIIFFTNYGMRRISSLTLLLAPTLSPVPRYFNFIMLVPEMNNQWNASQSTL